MFCFCSLRRSIVFFPALLLVALLIILGMLEYRIETRDTKIQEVLADPMPYAGFHLHEAAWNFSTVLDGAMSIATDKVQTFNLSEKVLGLRKQFEALIGTLNDNSRERQEHAHLNEPISIIGTSLPIIEELSQKESLTPSEALVLQRHAGKITYAIHKINEDIAETHQKIISELFSENQDEKGYRILLSSLVLLAGLLFYFALYRNSLCLEKNMEATRAAERFNAIFAAALQSVDVGVKIRDLVRPNEPVLFINKAFTKVTGYDVEDVKGKGIDFLFGWRTDEETVDQFKRAVHDRMAETFTFLAYRKDGTPFWAEWHLCPIFDKNGDATHYVSLLSDVTTMRQTQDALVLAKEQAERASTIKTHFLAVMSHEIRTPINGLMGVLSLFCETTMSEEQRRLLTIATSSGNSLLSIINDILDYAKMEAGKIDIILESFSLRELLKGVYDLTQPIASGKKLGLDLEVPETLSDRFFSDPGRLRQILLNLTTNAIKFTDSGKVTIRLLHLLDQDDHGTPVSLVRFEVIDTGIGISPTDQEKLFKEFSQIEHSYTRRFGGTGLGLAITRRLVRLLKGDIGVESKSGHGSKFWFMVPLAMASGAEAMDAGHGVSSRPPVPLEEQNKAPASEAARLLLVEDNDTNRFVATRYLTKAGYCPDVAATGIEALEMVKTGTYDLILMDVSMPEMDGLEATRRIRAIGGWRRTVPIIALTAHVMEGDREKCLAAGMDDYLNKPLEYGDLVRMLNHWLAATPSAPQAYVSTIPDSLAEQPEMDPSVLDRLAEDLGKDSVARIIKVFLNDVTQRQIVFSSQNVSDDIAKLSHEAHTIKSSSASCGLKRLSALMAQIESQIAMGEHESLEQLLLKAPEALEKAKTLLLDELKRFEA